jgi:hypothetical protein
MGFTNIFDSPGLPPTARRRARAAGPRAVAMRSDHRRLLGSAGFGDITELDVTPEFRASAAAWLAETAAHAEELVRLKAPGGFEQRQADRRAMLAAIDAGLLRRTPRPNNRTEASGERFERPSPHDVSRNRLHDRQPTATAPTVIPTTSAVSQG